MPKYGLNAAPTSQLLNYTDTGIVITGHMYYARVCIAAAI